MEQASLVNEPSPRIRRWHPLGDWPVSVLLLAAGGAWLATAGLASGMDSSAGTMGFNAIEYVGVWALMMAAMMLPSIAPLTVTYLAVSSGRRSVIAIQLALGYLAVWGVFGLLAFVLADLGGQLALASPDAARVAAVCVLMVCAGYQVTSLKDRCLTQCRTPVGQLMRYRTWSGRAAPIRVGLGHAAWCVGCCWSLMVALLALGVMNLVAMALLTTVILVEKVAAPGRWFSVCVGVAILTLAVAVAVDPALAAGLHANPGGMHMTMAEP